MLEQMMTYAFKLRPSRAQHATLGRILENERLLYNAALQERRNAYSKSGISIGFNDQTKSLTEIRSFDAAYGAVPYNVSKWTLKRLDDAMKAFFRRVKAKAGSAGFPRFRGCDGWNSFGLHQIGGMAVRNGCIRMKGVEGGLRLRMHRPLPDGAVPKSAVFTREGRAWRVSLTCAVPVEVGHARSGTLVGVDVGVNWLAVTSDGEFHENVRPRSARAKVLRRAQRALARCRKGSKRRAKVRAKLAREQRRARNARTTHLHDAANKIATSAETIFVEALKLANMTRSASGTLAEPGTNVAQKRGMNRSMADAAPGRLILMIRYKAARAGGTIIEVDPRNTSRTCSGCGIIDASQLSRRRYVCACGVNLDRDLNAAINIRERGLKAAREAARRLGEPNAAECRMRALGTAEPLAA